MKQKLSFLIALMHYVIMLNMVTACDDKEEDLSPVLNKDFSYTVEGNMVLVQTSIKDHTTWVTVTDNGAKYFENNGYIKVLLTDAGTYTLTFTYRYSPDVSYTSEEFSVTIQSDYKPILNTDFTIDTFDNYIVAHSELECDEMWITCADSTYLLTDGNVSIPTAGLGNYNLTFSYKNNSKIYTSEIFVVDVTTPVVDVDFNVSISDNNVTIKCDRDYKLMWVTFLDNNFVLMNGEVTIPLPSVGTHSMTFSYEDKEETYTSNKFEVTTDFPVNGTDYIVSVSGNYVTIENMRIDNYKYYNAYVNYSDSTYSLINKSKYNKVRIFIREPGTYSMSFFYKEEEKSEFYVTIETEYMSNIQAVDLGLSVKWANMNIDASSPEEVGYYYSWGNTEGLQKVSYGADKYHKLTKYCTESEYGENGFTDNLTTLEPIDDIAYVRLGGNWRMPTAEECLELVENTKYEWCDNYNDSGVAGFILTSKIDGYTNESIFLPVTGDYVFGYRAFYWSSSLCYWAGHYTSDKAETLYIYGSREPGADDQYSKEYRNESFPIRPVCTK